MDWFKYDKSGINSTAEAPNDHDASDKSGINSAAEAPNDHDASDLLKYAQVLLNAALQSALGNDFFIVIFVCDEGHIRCSTAWSCHCPW